MKHLLMDAAFPKKNGKWVLHEIDSKARVWTVVRDPAGKLCEEIDLPRLLKLNPDHSAEQIADALVLAAAAADIAETRDW